MKLNSIHGRLFVLINWKEITCIPCFINQTNYDHIFGFKIDPNEPINSKYLLNINFSFKYRCSILSIYLYCKFNTRSKN